MARFTPACAFLLLTPLLAPFAVAASSQDDAGTGGDAPNDMDSALLLEPGNYTGLVEPSSDLQDWYSMNVPPGMAARIELSTAAANTLLTLYSPDDNRGATGATGNASEPATLNVTPQDGGLVRLRVSGFFTGFWRDNRTDAIPYAFTLSIIHPADFRAAVAVPAPQEPIPGVSASLDLQRSVTVTFENAGLGDAIGIETVVAFTAPRSVRLLHFDVQPYAAGASRTLTIPWDATFQAGETQIVAILLPARPADSDKDWRDNAAAARTYVLAETGGTGAGADPLNLQVPQNDTAPLWMMEYSGEGNRTGTRQQANLYPPLGFEPWVTLEASLGLTGPSASARACILGRCAALP